MYEWFLEVQQKNFGLQSLRLNLLVTLPVLQQGNRYFFLAFEQMAKAHQLKAAATSQWQSISKLEEQWASGEAKAQKEPKAHFIEVCDDDYRSIS